MNFINSSKLLKIDPEALELCYFVNCTLFWPLSFTSVVMLIWILPFGAFLRCCSNLSSAFGWLFKNKSRKSLSTWGTKPNDWFNNKYNATFEHTLIANCTVPLYVASLWDMRIAGPISPGLGGTWRFSRIGLQAQYCFRYYDLCTKLGVLTVVLGGLEGYCARGALATRKLRRPQCTWRGRGRPEPLGQLAQLDQSQSEGPEAPPTRTPLARLCQACPTSSPRTNSAKITFWIKHESHFSVVRRRRHSNVQKARYLD